MSLEKHTLSTGYSLVITESPQVSFPFCLQMHPTPPAKRDAFHEVVLLKGGLSQLLPSILNTYLYTLMWSLHVDKGGEKGNFRNLSKGKLLWLPVGTGVRNRCQEALHSRTTGLTGMKPACLGFGLTLEHQAVNTFPGT